MRVMDRLYDIYTRYRHNIGYYMKVLLCIFIFYQVFNILAYNVIRDYRYNKNIYNSNNSILKNILRDNDRLVYTYITYRY